MEGRVLHIPDMKQFGMVGWWQGNREVAKGGWKVGQSFSKLYLPFNGPDKYIHWIFTILKTEVFHANFPPSSIKSWKVSNKGFIRMPTCQISISFTSLPFFQQRSCTTVQKVQDNYDYCLISMGTDKGYIPSFYINPFFDQQNGNQYKNSETGRSPRCDTCQVSTEECSIRFL